MSSVALMPGFRLDRYELLAPIAEGGMGQVWLARLLGKRGFEKLVAIKVSKLSADVHSQQGLLDEARIASAIEHVNVAQIVELGEHADMLYIVMEWVDGDALSTLLRALDKKDTPLPLAIALRIMSETCAGTHAAHELKDGEGNALEVVHRDISPQNMLITRAGSVKLIDFGIAKARSRIAGDTVEGTLKGKIKYMAPEQARGRKLDRRADIFSLGAVLYRLLAGHAPYDGENEVATLHLLISGKPPGELPASVPPPVAAIVHRALAHTPEARFQTAAEMQRAIVKAIADCHVPAEATDVASFLATHLQDRQRQRARAIEIALKAAGDRSKVADLLRPPPTTYSNTTGYPEEGASMSGGGGTASGNTADQSSVSSIGTVGTAGVQITGSEQSVLHATGQSSVFQGAPPDRLRAVYRLVSLAVALGSIGIVLIGVVLFTASRHPAPPPAAPAASAAAASAPAPSESVATTNARVDTIEIDAGDASSASSASASKNPKNKGGWVGPRGPKAPPKSTLPDFGY